MNRRFHRVDNFAAAELELLAQIRRATDDHHMKVSVAYADVLFSAAVAKRLALKPAGGDGRFNMSHLEGARLNLRELIRRGPRL